MRSGSEGGIPDVLHPDLKRCIDACLDCHRICLETFVHMLDLGGEHANRPHVTTLINCARICHTNADFMLSASPLHVITCRACAEVCEACARQCSQMNEEDLDRCVEVCRNCAEICREMSAH